MRTIGSGFDGRYPDAEIPILLTAHFEIDHVVRADGVRVGPCQDWEIEAKANYRRSSNFPVGSFITGSV
jgi:hypothetical protein